MLGTKAVEIVDRCVARHPYMSELEEMASSRTVAGAIKKLEDLGIIERYASRGGVGRPKVRCRLTRRGLRLKRVLDNIRFHAEYKRLSIAGIPVTAGILRSIAEGYGAPLIVGYELGVPRQLVKKARRMLEWDEIELDGIPWGGFYERSVQADDMRYLGLEDLIVLAATDKENPARLQACATTIIRDFTGRITYNLLLKIAVKARAINEVGGLLYLTNCLAGKNVVSGEILDGFQKRVEKRDVGRHARYHLLVAQGVPPSDAEHPVDVEIRETWHATLPTFEECQEVFGWRGRGKVG